MAVNDIYLVLRLVISASLVGLPHGFCFRLHLPNDLEGRVRKMNTMRPNKWKALPAYENGLLHRFPFKLRSDWVGELEGMMRS